jgi:hypothetical protein
MARDPAKVGARHRLVVPPLLEDAEGLERAGAAQELLTAALQSAHPRSTSEARARAELIEQSAREWRSRGANGVRFVATG